MDKREGAVESMVIDREFWRGKRVLITGHTGFKGSWLSLWLYLLGTEVTGYSLPPPTNPSLFEAARVGELMRASHTGDVRDLDHLIRFMRDTRPDIVIHMAAQPLVRYSYINPVETYTTNVLGTVNVFEAVRQVGGTRVLTNVTSDKCYENREWMWGYRENEPMGGYDPYSSSKGCAELVTSAYRNSFFNPDNFNDHGVALASVRAGNVIGGGDWSEDRLIPDILRAIMADRPAMIRNPHAIRPWQHVLEPLSGYLLLAQRLWEEGPVYAEAWNFGPDDEDARPVSWIADYLTQTWGRGASWHQNKGEHPHEAHYLKLDCSKAKTKLGWRPIWNLERALKATIEWYRAYQPGKSMRTVTLEQIEGYWKSA